MHTVSYTTFTRLIAIFLAAACLNLSAAVLTVDNNPGSIAMFKGLPEAYTAAKEGDTILIAGSDQEYGVNFQLRKRLNWVGPGYLLSENNVPGISKKPAQLKTGSTMSVAADLVNETSAAGSTFTGLVFGSPTYVSVPVTIDRCAGGWIGLNEQGVVTIRRSLLDWVEVIVPGSVVLNSIINGGAFATGTTAANCVIRAAARSTADESTSFSNCIFVVAPTESLTREDFAARFKGSISHSMAVRGSFLPEGGGNINGVSPIGNVFVATGSPDFDTYWQLKPGSPAIGKGQHGVDLGAFGGDMPYRLSGVPNIPRITRLVVPSIVNGSGPLRVEVSAESF